MNAPEKIYLNPALDALTEALSEKTEDDIEYTRTDAFIEKACNAFCKVCKMPNCNSKDCSYLKDFKNNMKGE